MYVDAHCHATGFKLSDLKKFTSDLNIIIVGVAEDLNTSRKIIEYSKKLNNFYPAIGIHPWTIDKISEDDVEKVLELGKKVKIIGEVGLDKKFVKETFEKQIPVFKRFVEFARDNDLALNLHAPGAWEDVLKIITDYGIKRANFHWYTGPTHLLREFEAQGYFISINPAVKIQKKHANIVAKAPIEILLTESDGPYSYRGMILSPEMIPETIREISKIKEMEEDIIKKEILKNFEKIIGNI